jgi:sucrose-6-phosphate hydrolase SacC (GH32 family)
MSPPKNNSPLDFVEVMNLKKKKVEKYTEEIRKEKELKEMENCTFKPKINNYNLRDNVVPLDGGGNQRIELLYKKGTENLINKKKTKTKVDIDFEKNGRECSFKPNIYER